MEKGWGGYMGRWYMQPGARKAGGQEREKDIYRGSMVWGFTEEDDRIEGAVTRAERTEYGINA